LPSHTTYNDTYWQTETGHTISANFAKPEVLEPSPGSCIKPYPGFDVRVLNEAGKEVGPGELGFVCTKLPNPPSFMTTLWNNDEAFINKYLKQYPGYYMTGDAGYFAGDNNYLHISTRIDDVINTAGHRLSTSQIEESLLGHPALAEAAVIALTDELKGEIPLGLVVIKSGVKLDVATLKKDLVVLVRKDIGPVACYGSTIIVERLPKTKSGKILRGLMKKMLNGMDFKAPATIENLDAVDEVMCRMSQAGFGIRVDLEFSPTKIKGKGQGLIDFAEETELFGELGARNPENKSNEPEVRLDHMI
jgi:propionyl-CoA synthetase